jgi:hypothetical protein
MANGVLVRSHAKWSGMLKLEGTKAQGTFEVFDSGGGWSFLFGKPLLKAFKAQHEYEQDTIQVRSEGCEAMLTNQLNVPYYADHK